MTQRYSYTARNGDRRDECGEIEAEDSKEALEKLHARGLFPLTLSLCQVVGDVRMSVRARMIEDLVGHLYLFAKARHDAVTALSAFEGRYAAGSGEAGFVRGLLRRAQQGVPLSDLLHESFPGLSPLVVPLVRAGESAGDLAPALEAAQGIIERDRQLRGRLAAAMAYPTVLSVVGCASLVAILTFVVPRLKPALETADVSGFVRFLFACSDALRTPQGWAVVAIVAAVTVVIMLRWGSVLLGAFGPYRSFLAARREYAAIAGLRFLAAAHVPLPDAMEAMAACERDTAQRNVLRDAAASLSRGEPFSDIVRRMRLFGAFFASVAGAGYASGSLADALSAAQEEARQRMEKALAVLCAVVEPAVLTVIGVCVGGAVIALLLPLLDAAQRAY